MISPLFDITGRIAVVGTLIYLCSDASRFLNGQVVYVDGGMLAVL